MGSNLQVHDVMGDSLVLLIPRIAVLFEAPLLIFCQALTEILSFALRLAFQRMHFITGELK